MLILLDKLPESSEFKKVAERDGRQTRAEEVAEATHNELAYSRAAYYTVNGGEAATYDPHIYRDPLDEKVIAEREAEEAAAAAASLQEFNSQIGFA